MGAVCYGGSDITPFSFILGTGFTPSVNHLIFQTYVDGGKRYFCFYLENDGSTYVDQYHIYIYMIKNASYRGMFTYNNTYGYDIVDRSVLPTV